MAEGDSSSGSSTSSSGSSTTGSSGGTSSSTSGGDYTLVSGISSGYSVFGVVQVGANNPSEDPPGYYVAVESGTQAQRQMLWDGDLENGFDSDRQEFEFVSDLAGHSTEMAVSSVGDDGSISMEASGSGYILKLQIAAQVNAANMRFTWSVIVVTFGNEAGASAVLTLPPEVAPVADTFDGEESSSQLVVEITPPRGDFTSVAVQGVLQLESNLGTQPAPDAMIGKILVFSTGS